jgi:hypothetical protein
VTAEEYLREVEFALRDLPWSQRRDLVAELGAHLAELPPDADLRPRLGWPAQYAADLRAAAGLERQHGIRSYLRARRPRNVILVTLAVVVFSLAIGLGIGALVWIESYQPLGYGDSSQLPLDSRSTLGARGVTVFFRDGRPFLYGVTIRNNGRFPVRILAVPTYHVTDFYKARLLMNKPNPADNERPLQPFRPFDLRPGTERWLVWKGVYSCTTGTSGPGVPPKHSGYTVSTNTAIPVRYSFLWRTATAEIPLDEPLAMSFAKEGCPPGGDPPSKQEPRP